MIYIYTFGTTYAASPYAYSAEVLPTKNRANGLALGLLIGNAVTLTFSQVAPMALQSIGWKFNLVFICCNCFFFVIVFFFFPEVSLIPPGRLALLCSHSCRANRSGSDQGTYT
jgi:hypothetical protein